METAKKSKKCFIVQVVFSICLVSLTYWYTELSSMPNLKEVYEQIPNMTANFHQKFQESLGIGPRENYVAYEAIPQPRVNETNCWNLFIGRERGEPYEHIDNLEWHLPDEYFINATDDCASFISTRQYITKPISQEEAEFPLAFSLVVYKDVCQVEQLLRTIYRPQNYYCIHTDPKASAPVQIALTNIAKCFDNVFIATRLVSVWWGTYSVLDAELSCMRDLWNKTNWRYFINLTGQEFPLKTVLDIIQILKTYNGSNAIGFDFKNYIRFRNRIQYHYIRAGLPSRWQPKPPPPHGIQITFGGVHVALTRAFVGFALHNNISNDFLNWLKDTNIPDETYFASLHINPQLGVPGAFTGDPKTLWRQNDPYTRFKQWYSCRKQRSLKVHFICILGVHDLPTLYKSPYMFANKFFHYFQPVARMCLEEWIFNRTREQLLRRSRLDLERYRQPAFVRQHSPS